MLLIEQQYGCELADDEYYKYCKLPATMVVISWLGI